MVRIPPPGHNVTPVPPATARTPAALREFYTRDAANRQRAERRALVRRLAAAVGLSEVELRQAIAGLLEDGQ